MTDLTRLTVNLVPQALEALEAASAATGDTDTETVNRALQLYRQVVLAVGEPRRTFIFDVTDDRSVKVVVRPVDHE